jgi:hypothetical protein
MIKYDLKSPFSQLSNDIYIYWMIPKFGGDTAKFVQGSHCYSFVADTQ